MALVFMDSFDHYASGDVLKKWDYWGGYVWGAIYIGVTVQNIPVRRSGTKYLFVGDQWVERDVVDVVTGLDIYTFVVGFACYYQQGCDNMNVYMMTSDRDTQIRINITSDGKVKIYRGSTLLEETPQDYVSPGTWFHIEAKVVLDDTVGSYEVRLNEVTVLSGSGIDTQAYSGEGVAKIRLSGGQYQSGYGAFDDFFFLDGNASDDPANLNNDFLGDCRIDCIYPNAAGDYTDFTPYPSAPNYENVDDPHITEGGDIDDDETYNESPTVGHKDIYNLESVEALGTPIYAAAQNSCMRKTDAGRRYVRQLIKVNGTDYLRDTGLTNNDGEWYLTDNYKVTQRPLDVNPDTELAWTESDLNSLQSGVQITV